MKKLGLMMTAAVALALLPSSCASRQGGEVAAGILQDTGVGLSGF